MSEPEIRKLLEGSLKVVNVGLEDFARDLDRRGVVVVHVDWSPPADGDPELADLLSRLGT